jgi:hypothetical protein
MLIGLVAAVLAPVVMTEDADEPRMDQMRPPAMSR